MIILDEQEVLGKCKFCNKLLTENIEHYVVNRGLHLYRICNSCYNDLRKVGGKSNGDEGRINRQDK